VELQWRSISTKHNKREKATKLKINIVNKLTDSLSKMNPFFQFVDSDSSDEIVTFKYVLPKTVCD
jgi:hypothetical protein